MRMMRVCGRLFPLAGKSTENITTPAGARLPLHGSVDAILAKAAQCMMPEVGGRGLVAFVLITSNALCFRLAFLRRTPEEVGDTAIVYLDSDVGFEERIYRGPPSLLRCC